MIRPLLRCAALVALFFSASCSSTPYDSSLCRMPRVMGMWHKDAHDAILLSHLMPKCFPEADYDVNGKPLICSGQSPAPGTMLRCGEVVDLVFNPEYRSLTTADGPR